MTDYSMSSTPTRHHHRELPLTVPPLKISRKRGEASEGNAMDEEVPSPSIVITVNGQCQRSFSNLCTYYMLGWHPLVPLMTLLRVIDGNGLLGKIFEEFLPVVNLHNLDGRALLYQIKRNTQFIKLFTAYCEKCQVNHRSLQFFHLGQRILGKDTPDMLNMEEADEIDAMTHVFGGACKG
ncbi:small ubiquitin-related modifier 2-like [Fagus crenata]